MTSLGPLDLSSPHLVGYVLALVDGTEVNRREITSADEFDSYLADAQTADGGVLDALADELVANPYRTTVEVVLVSVTDGVVGARTSKAVYVPEPPSLFQISQDLRAAAGTAIADADHDEANASLLRKVGYVLISLAAEIEDCAFLNPSTIKRARLLAGVIHDRHSTTVAKGKKK